MLLRLHENGELHLSVYVYELEDFVDESALRRVFEALTVNHPILRTTWAESNSGYCQVLLPSSAVSFSSFDGCILNHIQQTKAVILTPGQRNARFSLIRDKSRGTTFLTIAIHHAFCDAFTRYLLEQDFIRALEAPDDIQRGPQKPCLFRFRLTDTDESIQLILRRVQRELASHANYEHGLTTLHSSGLPPVQCLLNVKLGTHTMQSTSIGGMTIHPRRDLESWDVQLPTSIYLEVAQELSGISMKMCYRSEHIGHQKAQLLFENFHGILDNIDGEDFGVGRLIA
ncbi:hypothetical protein BDV24DRAFT_175620 [Aspergillus arachidicola]|uniref:Condensation domain-containing protein n=1 Tax=Aspergillus arachidicola TaxID=656916 RepID=A0A5N6YT31_9EURO|nr:hypothetical protein BDV24DRAFT_175620 [Aspergillus arachidicola]